ncbi:MAG: RsmD family RNA methyltransferase [Bacteroidales bacterium]|nr:RsmD family RNA methyltransferase [Bacteroidales bacterium]
MRIISGKYGGRILKPSKKLDARPTTDFAKENLFNVLENRFNFENLTALDLFSGTGNISFELISRGCRQVTAIEKNPGNIKFINQIVEKLGIENLNVIKKDVFKFIASTNEQYDLIFADPPYHLEGIETLPQRINEYNLLKKHGYFILEHSGKTVIPESQQLIEQRRYGHVNFSFFTTPA